MVKNIYVIRHCKAEGQSPDASLTDEGIVQAKALAAFLSGRQIDYIVSSPFKRAVKTIEPFAKKLGIDIEVDDRLRERALSSTQMPDWLEKLKATFLDMDLQYEGGESSNEAMKRIVKVIDDIASGGSDNAAIVTHGRIMSLLLHYYNPAFSFEQWKGLSNPDVYRLCITQDDSFLEHLWRI